VKNPLIETLVEVEERTNANGSSGPSLLDLIAEGRSAQALPPGGVIVGKFVGFDESGNPLVDFIAGVSHEAVVARSMISLRKSRTGSDVVLAFEYGDIAKPIITGALCQPENSPKQEPVAIAELDGERVMLTAEKEIVLRCGKASITLTQAGKVLIRGAYLSTHSSGVNRIKGGSVQIN
jgi:hypothetical protein